jgi:hypothetical protein
MVLTDTAGLRMDEVSGSQKSCFIGYFTNDFEHIRNHDKELSLFPPFPNRSNTADIATGNTMQLELLVL